MKLPDRTFEKKLKQQHCRCYYCGEYLFDSKFEIDHLIAKSKGGSSRVQNLVLACYSCNRTKSNKPYEYLRLKLKAKGLLMRGDLFYFEFLGLQYNE